MKSYLRTKDFFLTKESFELLYDENLDMLVTDPKPKEMTYYYASDAYISHTDSSKTLFDKLYQQIKKVNLRNKFGLVKKYSKEKKPILDFGAGTGDFLGYVQSKGWRTLGVEPIETARLLAKEKGVELKAQLEVLPNEQFGAITLWHVLEHIPDLENVIKKLCKLLHDEGVLVVAVPNFKSFDAKYYRKHWAAYDVPRHLWHFSKTSIKEIFAEHQMEVIDIKPMWFDAFYVSLLSEKYKSGKKNWLKAIAIGMWSNIKGIVTKEYSSHIYILKKTNKRH